MGVMIFCAETVPIDSRPGQSGTKLKANTKDNQSNPQRNPFAVLHESYCSITRGGLDRRQKLPAVLMWSPLWFFCWRWRAAPLGGAGCTPTSNADAAIGIAIMRYFVIQGASILILRGHANGFYNLVLLCFFDLWSLSKHQAATYRRVADDFDGITYNDKCPCSAFVA